MLFYFKVTKINYDENIYRDLFNDLKEAMGYCSGTWGWYYAEYCGTKFEWELCDAFKIIYKTNQNGNHEETYDMFNINKEELISLIKKVNGFKEAHLKAKEYVSLGN